MYEKGRSIRSFARAGEAIDAHDVAGSWYCSAVMQGWLREKNCGEFQAIDLRHQRSDIETRAGDRRDWRPGEPRRAER